MPTRPIPIWERWMQEPKKRERIFTIFYISMIALNAFIIIGLVMFFIFLFLLDKN